MRSEYITLLKQRTETADRKRENTIASSRKYIIRLAHHFFARMREFGWGLLLFDSVEYNILHWRWMNRGVKKAY